MADFDQAKFEKLRDQSFSRHRRRDGYVHGLHRGPDRGVQGAAAPWPSPSGGIGRARRRRSALSPRMALVKCGERTPTTIRRTVPSVFRRNRSHFRGRRHDEEHAGVRSRSDGPGRHLHEEAIDVFRSGMGVRGTPIANVASATDRGFRPVYEENFSSKSWIPSLVGVAEKLFKRGGKIADIGCGHGSSSLLLAKAFPNSDSDGFHVHPPSIVHASRQAAEAGVANTKFEVASAKAFPGGDYDLICVFDVLHDMGGPVGASRHVRSALGGDGSATWSSNRSRRITSETI